MNDRRLTATRRIKAAGEAAAARSPTRRRALRARSRRCGGSQDGRHLSPQCRLVEPPNHRQPRALVADLQAGGRRRRRVRSVENSLGILYATVEGGLPHVQPGTRRRRHAREGGYDRHRRQRRRQAQCRRGAHGGDRRPPHALTGTTGESRTHDARDRRQASAEDVGDDRIRRRLPADGADRRQQTPARALRPGEPRFGLRRGRSGPYVANQRG